MNNLPKSLPKILIILPAYNEQGKIGTVVKKIKATDTLCQILVVDDCSTDNTRSEAISAGAEVISHEKNSGVGAGIRTGIKYGIEKGFEIGVVMSGDDQHEPVELPRALEPIESGEYDFAQGSRYMEGGQVINEKKFRKITTIWYSRFFSVLTGRKVTDATNGFRSFKFSIFSDSEINLDQEWLNGYELEPYLLYKIVTNRRYKYTEVPITVRYHATGKEYTKMRPVRDWWRLARPMFILKLGLKR